MENLKLMEEARLLASLVEQWVDKKKLNYMKLKFLQQDL